MGNSGKNFRRIFKPSLSENFVLLVIGQITMLQVIQKNITSLLLKSNTTLTSYPMGLIRAAAIVARENRFRTLSLELKCLGTTVGALKQRLSISRDSTWLPVINFEAYTEE